MIESIHQIIPMGNQRQPNDENNNYVIENTNVRNRITPLPLLQISSRCYAGASSRTPGGRRLVGVGQLAVGVCFCFF